MKIFLPSFKKRMKFYVNNAEVLYRNNFDLIVIMDNEIPEKEKKIIERKIRKALKPKIIWKA